MKRTTSFGYGNRSNFSFKANSPPPNRYDLPSLFKDQNLAGLRYTFGIAREAYAKVYLKQHPHKDGCVPGPGAYEVRSVPGKEANKYTFRPKTTNLSIITNFIY